MKGGKILGKYPSDLKVNNELDVGRGRFIPTMPFEAPWNAVSQWLGVEDESELEQILPNRKSFPDTMLLDSNDMFGLENQNYNKGKCEDEGRVVSCVATNTIADDDYYEWYDDINADTETPNELAIEMSGAAGAISVALPTVLIVIGVGLVLMFFKRRRDAGAKYACFDNDDTFDLSDDEASVENIESVNVYHYKKNQGVEIATSGTEAKSNRSIC